MKKTVWTFGLISGAVISAMMLLTLPFEGRIGYDNALVVGYTTMVAAFLLVFFGIKSYRDNVAGGEIGFWRALAIGALITVISSACYTLTWEAVFFGRPDFAARFMAFQTDHIRETAANEADARKRLADAQHFAELYMNPAYNSALTFLEPLPVGLVIALVSAGILSRKRRGPAGQVGVVA
jgi:hypothetical protein